MRLSPHPARDRASTGYRLWTGLLLVLACAAWVAYFAHLRADFPNNSPWEDWAKYTDEGWYGDAAIRHFERGSWYVAGDFNPAAALPVFPLLEAAVFAGTGVGIVPARAFAVGIFGAILVVSFLLLRRVRRPENQATDLSAAAAVLLMAVSPFFYAFMRMAILEPLLILLTLLALLVADAGPPEGATHTGTARTLRLAALAVLLPAMVLTKTTAIFLVPAIVWLLWARGGFRLRALVRDGGTAAAAGLALWLAYYAFVIRPHYLADFRYLFSANAYTNSTLSELPKVLWQTVLDAAWIGYIAPVCGVILLLALFFMRRSLAEHLRQQRIAVALVIWVLGYTLFLVYHNNLQPRYFLVLAVPLTLLAPLALEQIWSRTRSWLPRVAVLGSAAALAVVAALGARSTIGFVRSPEYDFFNAAQRIAAITRSDPSRSPLVLSISGSDLSLMAGIPSICDDFGTMELADRVAAYRPGWYAAWNQVDDDKMDALAPLYHLHRVAAFPAMDDPERNLLILYRLDPPTGERPAHRRRRGTPRRLETRLGQQPSVIQLQH